MRVVMTATHLTGAAAAKANPRSQLPLTTRPPYSRHRYNLIVKYLGYCFGICAFTAAFNGPKKETNL